MARRAAAAGRLRAARLTACWKLVYATGLRVSELVALPASAAERNARMLVVRGKGGKERLVPLNEAAKTRHDASIARCWRKRPPPRGEARRRIRNGCFLLSAKAAISRASISPAS